MKRYLWITLIICIFALITSSLWWYIWANSRVLTQTVTIDKECPICQTCKINCTETGNNITCQIPDGRVLNIQKIWESELK